jgi:hypothetical protein
MDELGRSSLPRKAEMNQGWQPLSTLLHCSEYVEGTCCTGEMVQRVPGKGSRLEQWRNRLRPQPRAAC